MGESSGCLLRSFSQPSPTSNQANEVDPLRALTTSISFGRFMSESLAWEKWSAFNHNRYMEEVERCSKPGSVAEKKAYFEAHYKRIAAKKAAALLEQANNDNVDEIDNNSSSMNLETENSDSCLTVDSIKETEALLDCERILDVDDKRVEIEEPVLEQGKSKITDSANQKKPEVSSLKTSKLRDSVTMTAIQQNKNVTAKSKKLSVEKKRSTPKSLQMSVNFQPDKNDTAESKKPSMEKKRSTPKSLHMSVNFTSRADEIGKTSSPIIQKIGKITHQQENRSGRAILRQSVSESITPVEKSPSLSKGQTVPSSSCGRKTQSPTVTSSFTFRSEERAAKRKEKLEEKLNTAEAEKVRLQSKSKEKAHRDFEKMRRSVSLNAKPIASSQRQTESPSKKHAKKIPPTPPRPYSPKIYAKQSVSTIQETTHRPPWGSSMKSDGSNKTGIRKNNLNLNRSISSSLKKKNSCENASPNIQLQV